MGMGWKVEDLAKPQIMVESTFGDSHPGSAHLDQFVKEAVQAVNDNGGKAARYFATDMCDGIAQGHDGINYSLPHRDAIVNLVEAQANASVYDGGVFIASCDKSVPAMLMSIGRLKEMSAIVVTGGVMVFVWKYLVAPMGGALAIYELLPAFLCACVAIVMVSLLTPAPEQSILEAFECFKSKQKQK